MKRKSKLIALALITVCLLVSCNKLPSNYAMDQFIASKVGGENVKRIDRTEHGNYVLFEYESEDRELAFQSYGESTEGKNLLTDGADLMTNYATVIHDLYIDDVEDVICGSLDAIFTKSEYDYETLYYFECELFDMDGADDIIDTVIEADNLYNQELEYHNSDWLKNNKLATLKVLCHKPDGSAVYEMIYINGSNKESDMRSLLEHGCS